MRGGATWHRDGRIVVVVAALPNGRIWRRVLVAALDDWRNVAVYPLSDEIDWIIEKCENIGRD